MLIFSSSTFQIDRLLEHSARLSMLALGILSFLLLSLFFFYPFSSKESLNREIEGGKKNGTLFAYEAIGTGGLALHPRHALGWVSRLADELTLLAYNSRPDAISKEVKLLISLKHGKELLQLPNGKAFYLKENAQGKGLSLSNETTGLWIKPILLENGAVLMEARRKFILNEDRESEEKGEFVLAPQGGVPAQYHPLQQPFIQELKQAHGFSQDLLIQKYGDREYASWRDKAILELTHGTETYACFLSSGDFLSYEEGEWRIKSLKELKSDQPVAHVKTASSRGVELEVWDETGFSPLIVKIEVEKPVRFQFKPELLPTKIRLRNTHAVSCAFGKRRIILKKGDWLLKTPTGWRNLRRAEEIERYLHHRLKGELFIFDTIEKEQGRQVMKGNLFDETRTQSQPISLTIESEKAPGKASRKRKPISANSERRAA